MKKPNSIYWFVPVAAVIAAAVLLYPRFSIEYAVEPGERIGDSASSISADSEAAAPIELAPERGLWPGLPPLSTIGVVSDLGPRDSDRRPEVESDADNIDESATLLERVESFDDLPVRQRGSIAFRIAEDWRKCGGFRPLTQEEIGERVENRLRGGHDFAMSIIAQAPDGPQTDAAIEEIASMDPDDVRAHILADELLKQRLCSGVERMDPRKVIGAELVWLRTAARLGNYSAQHAFLNKVFSAYRPIGQAVQLAEDKQLVLEIIAGRLQRRDLLVLERIAEFAGEGYFGPPDPVLGHAYAQAAILAAEHQGQSSWNLINPDPGRVQRLIAMIDFNTRNFRQVLTPSELAEAEDLALEIALLGAPP